MKIKMLIAAFLILIVSIVQSSTVNAYNSYPYDPSVCILGGCFLWIVIWFIIWLAIAIWVYKDAERRGKDGGLWLIIVVLLGIIGIIIWLIIRPPIVYHTQQQPASQGRMCPNCGRPIPWDARVCPYCGKRFE